MACKIQIKENLHNEVKQYFDSTGLFGVNPDIVKPQIKRVNKDYYNTVAKLITEPGNDLFNIEINIPDALIELYHTAAVEFEKGDVNDNSTLNVDNPNVDPFTGQGLLFDLGNDSDKTFQSGLYDIIMRFLEGEGYTLRTLEQYKKDFPGVLGDQPVAALIDMTNNTIAWSKKEGTKTLLEEAMHIVVHGMWESPRIQTIRTARNEDGRRWIEYSKEWQENYNAYKEKYEDRANWEELVEQEIVTKIITNFANEYFNTDRHKSLNRFQRMLVRFLNWIRRRFSQKESVDNTIKRNIPAEIQNVLGDISSEFYNSQLTLDQSIVSQEVITTQGDKSASRVGAIMDRTLSTLRQKRVQAVEEFKRVFTQEMKARRKELEVEFTSAQLSDLYNLGMGLIEIRGNHTFSPTQMAVLEEFRSLLKAQGKDSKINKSLDHFNKQISVLTRTIDSFEYQRALDIFINGFTYTDSDGVNHKVPSITDRLNTIDRNLSKDNSKLGLQDFLQASNFLETYQNIIKEILTLDKKDLTAVSTNEAKKILRGISNINERFLGLEKRVSKLWKDKILRDLITDMYTDDSGRLIDPDMKIDNIINDPQMDRKNWELYIGLLRNARQWQLQSFITKWADLYHNVNMKTQDAGYDLVSTLKNLTPGLKTNNTVRRYMRKYGVRNVEQLIMEHHNDQVSGYYLNKWNLGHWTKNREIEADRIYDHMENYIKFKFGVDAKIPRGSTAQESRIRRAWFFTASRTIDPDNVEGKNINSIHNEYKKQWGAWFLHNTIAHPDIVNIVRDRENQMTSSEFTEWRRQNFHVFIDTQGNRREVPIGELSVPSNGSRITRGQSVITTTDYSSQAFSELMEIPEFKQLHEEYRKIKDQSDDKLPIHMTSNYAFRQQLPQISKSSADILHRHGNVFKLIVNRNKRAEFWKDLKDIFIGAFSDRVDDEIYGRKITVSESYLPPIGTPPIRFATLLDDSSLLTRDITRSSISYYQMAETFDAAGKNMDFFDGLMQAVKRSSFIRKNFNKDIINVEGDKSRTLANLKEAFRLYIYDESLKEFKVPVLGKEVNVTKVSQLLLNWMRDRNLKMNFPAIGTGFLMAYGKENIIETLIGRTITKESNLWATKKLYSNMGDILSNTEIPIKTNKISALIKRTNLIDDTRSYFSNLDKNKVERILSSTYDYGLWRAADFLPKTQGMLAIMNNYRLIDGKWYTRESWLQKKGGLGEWKENEANNFYDLLDFTSDFKLESDVIGDFEWNFVINTSKQLAANLDTQPSELDKISFKQHAFGQFIFLHRSWMALGLERRLKKRHYNRYVNKWEEGQYKWIYDVFNRKNSEIRFEDVLFKHRRDQLRPEQREGIARTMYELALLNFTFWFAYLINMIAARDDEEEDAMLQYAAYLATRTYMEQMAFYSPGEMLDLVGRPVAGVDFYKEIRSGLKYMYHPDGKKTLKSGPYKGKTKRAKAWIRLTPNLKGYYETMPLEFLPFQEGAKGIQGKNTYIKNRVLGQSEIIDKTWTFPARITTGLFDEDAILPGLKDAN